MKKHFQIINGMAVREMIPVMIVIVIVLRYTYGFFGVLQSATIQSIAVRNYAFETFRHRSRLSYLREVGTLGTRSRAVRHPVRH